MIESAAAVLDESDMAALVRIGDHVDHVAHYSRGDISRFATLTLDSNPVHHDVDAAARAGLPDVIASGQHTSALMSGLEPGNLELIDTGNPKVFAFRRTKGRDRVTVAVNLSANPAQVALHGAGQRQAQLAGWGWSIE